MPARVAGTRQVKAAGARWVPENKICGCGAGADISKTICGYGDISYPHTSITVNI